MTTTRTRRPKAPARSRKQPRASIPVPQVAARKVIVASDGSDAALAALKLCHRMEQLGAWKPEVVTVLEPLPVAMSEIALAPPPTQYQQVVSDSLLQRITRQVHRHGSKTWKVSVEFGRVAPSIVEAARTSRASLVVLGLGRHGKLAQLLGAETASRVARLSRAPVLAVAANARGAPRTCIVAMDFGDSSIAAAREALHLLERPARLHLLHVRFAFEGHTGRDAAWERTYADGVEIGFARVLDQLGSQPGVKITSEMKLGGVTETILAVAKKMDADLLAIGRHNHDLLDRVLIGSTPSHVLRAAECSVLVAPPSGDSDAA